MPDPSPLRDPAFKPPGIFEKMREAFGLERPLDCAQIEVTSFCSGGCVYCPHTTQAKNWKRRHMDAATFASLWPALRQAKRAHLQGWGEPLLNPLFFEFQAFAKKAGCNTSTTTCGLVMNDEIAEKIAISGMDLIAFSLAGTDAQSNSARAGVPFEKVCAAIKTLRKAINNSPASQRPEIHIAYLLLADRVPAIARLPELMEELDAEMAVVSTLDYLAHPGQKDLAFYPSETEKIKRAEAALIEAADRAEKSGRLIYYSLPEAASQGGCRENPGKCLYIDADGYISPCVYLNVPAYDGDSARRVYGNSREEDILTIWRKEEYRKFRRDLLAGKPDSACLACPKRNEGGAG